MDRKIVGFQLDEKQDWTAVLNCGHLQHTRHRPPFEIRNWVTTKEGRDSMLSSMLNCVRCDEFEIPINFTKFSETPEFNENRLPEALKKDHKTQVGIWGKIVVTEGRVLYHVKDLIEELMPERAGIIVPELVHRVEPVGAVIFHIEFYRDSTK